MSMHMPLFVEALMFYIRREISSAYWNVHQRAFYEAAYDELGGRDKGFDPLSQPPLGITGMEWRFYDYDKTEDSPNLPNFEFEGVEIWWYKNLGTGMVCNVNWSPAQWSWWFKRCVWTIKAWQAEKQPHYSFYCKYPDPREVIDVSSCLTRPSIGETGDDWWCLYCERGESEAHRPWCVKQAPETGLK